MKTCCKSILAALLFLLAACDDGRIEKLEYVSDREGRTVELTGSFTGLNSWANGYHVEIGGFDGTSDYPIISKSLPVSGSEGGQMTVSMDGVTSAVTSLELCVVNRLRQRVVTFARVDCSEEDGDVITMDVGSMDVGMFSGVQQGIFNRTCASCHGSSAGTPAGGVDLRDVERSYASLVGQPSTLVGGSMRVNPGNAEESVLYQLLTTDISSSWRIDHSQMVSTSVEKNLVRDWINEGANP